MLFLFYENEMNNVELLPMEQFVCPKCNEESYAKLTVLSKLGTVHQVVIPNKIECPYCKNIFVTGKPDKEFHFEFICDECGVSNVRSSKSLESVVFCSSCRSEFFSEFSPYILNYWKENKKLNLLFF